MTRVIVLIAIASLIWTPIGIYVGLRPHLTQVVQPVAQFLAAFPANLLFPFVVSLIVAWNLNPDIWLSPLMVLGTQWYILFNVIAGASALPRELRDVSDNFQIKGWLWWRKVALPAVFPVLRNGRDHGFGRFVERGRCRRNRRVGQQDAARLWPGRVHHRRHHGGRFPQNRARASR